MSVYDQYETVIGLEIHVQLETLSKAFCGDDASFGGEPNTHVGPVSLGLPGTLPRANAKQVEYAVKLGLALDCQINQLNTFDRKNYFYADLPKGYQITQDRLPVCAGGGLNIRVNGKEKHIRLHHIHMEEDAGKSIHDLQPEYSLIDLNRAGVPLLEIVTEPDFRSPEEVDAFMSAIRQLVRYLGISDGNMEEGSMRCDCNVSIRLKGEDVLNSRCEIKNINSMRFARRAIEFETKRQIDIVEAGGKVEQQTLNFDPESGVTSPLRDKENANDYRYFPEPDLSPIQLSNEYVKKIEDALPYLPNELHTKFTHAYCLPEHDADLLTEDKSTALFYLDLTKYTPYFKQASNLVINKIMPWVQENGIAIDQFPAPKDKLSDLLLLVEEGKISNSLAYQRLFPALIAFPDKKTADLVDELNLVQTSDSTALEPLISDIIARFPDKVKEFQKGKKGLIGFFMGELMKSSQGKADPKVASGLLEEMLKN